MTRRIQVSRNANTARASSVPRSLGADIFCSGASRDEQPSSSGLQLFSIPLAVNVNYKRIYFAAHLNGIQLFVDGTDIPDGAITGWFQDFNNTSLHSPTEIRTTADNQSVTITSVGDFGRGVYDFGLVLHVGVANADVALDWAGGQMQAIIGQDVDDATCPWGSGGV